ncbi:MAG: hypothetical protein KF878_20080 [Planctomycetes bacterium]|nr:hypothetical protein [Planctomycetota bacterium]
MRLLTCVVLASGLLAASSLAQDEPRAERRAPLAGRQPLELLALAAEEAQALPARSGRRELLDQVAIALDDADRARARAVRQAQLTRTLEEAARLESPAWRADAQVAAARSLAHAGFREAARAALAQATESALACRAPPSWSRSGVAVAR